MKIELIKSVYSQGAYYLKSGKIIDCIKHALDFIYTTVLYRYNNSQSRSKKMLRKIVLYSQKNCEYYNKIKGDYEDFPILTKEIIRNNYDYLCSKNINKMIYNKAYTGGSTGSALAFFQSSSVDGFFQTKLWERFGYKSGDTILCMTGTQIDDNLLKSNIFWVDRKCPELPYGRYVLSSLYFNESSASFYFDFLNKQRPSFIRGYPSFLFEISNYIINNSLKINFKLKGIELTSESTYPQQIEIIEKAFQTKVFMQYGHTEQCVFAYTFDDSKRYIVEPLYGYVEVLKGDGSIAKEGEIGRIVATSLHNYVMPFIKYDTGDYAEVGRSENGKLVLNKIIGRKQDVIYDKNANKIFVTSIGDIHFKAFDNIIQWQIEQYNEGIIIMHIIKSSNYNLDDEKEIEKFFNEEWNINVKFDYCKNINKTKAGKMMLLVQHIKSK